MSTHQKAALAAGILRHRLINQQLAGSTGKTPKAVLRHMGALQAQDYAMSKWALGVRTAGSTDALIEKAIDAGELIRTHILRPTWHWVAAEDVRWMMTLTAPHVNRLASSMYRQLELDEALLARTNHLIARLLEGGKQLTREEIAAALARENIQTNPPRASHILFRAELDQVVCNGSRRGKQLTYALFDERVPPAKPLDREEALARLMRTYFSSRGPATLHDFAWWSGLTLNEIKRGIEPLKPTLEARTIEGKTYWYAAAQADGLAAADVVHLLPAFDEFTISYADRSLCLDASLAKVAILGNGIFKPVAAVNGNIIGTWKRTLQKNAVRVELYYPDGTNEPPRDIFAPCAAQYGRFLNLNVTLA